MPTNPMQQRRSGRSTDARPEWAGEQGAAAGRRLHAVAEREIVGVPLSTMTMAKGIRWIALGMLGASTVLVWSTPAGAGASFDLGEKALRAQTIAEIEITAIPKTLGWTAANERAHRGKIIRVVFSSTDVSPAPAKLLRFPFSLLSRCWQRIEKEQALRLLVFLPEDTVSGIEADDGAYSSLNADYGQLAEAITTVSAWRRESPDLAGEPAKVRLVSRTSNPYLRYLGARFIHENAHDPPKTIERALATTPSRIAAPEADCAKRGGPGQPSR